MEGKTASKADQVVAGGSKESLKRKHPDSKSELKENEENAGPLPITKLEVISWIDLV